MRDGLSCAGVASGATKLSRSPPPSLARSLALSRYDGLFHIVDWLPTLLSAAAVGANASASSPAPRAAAATRGGGGDDGASDSVDQWAALLGRASGAPPRTTMVYNLDTCVGGVDGAVGAVRVGDLKLLVNESAQASWPVPRTNAPAEAYLALAQDAATDRVAVQLYNLSADPNEALDLAPAAPHLAAWLLDVVAAYRATMAGAVACLADDGPNTYYAVWAKHNRTVGPWRLDPLAMYACSRETCPAAGEVPTPAPTPFPSYAPTRAPTRFASYGPSPAPSRRQSRPPSYAPSRSTAP